MAPANPKIKESIIEFYKLHSKKGQGYTYNQWKHCGLSRATIFRLLEKFDKEGNIERNDIVIRMFENLKGRIHLAKESGDGLSSLIKF
jgi:hypothetical protein